MKIKLFVLINLTVIFTCINVYASDLCILPYAKTTHVSINTGDDNGWEIVSPQNTGDIVITKSGTLIMSPNISAQSLVIRNDVSEKEYRFLDPIFINFEEHNLNDREIYFEQVNVVYDENNNYFASTQNNTTILNVEDAAIDTGVLTLEFDIYKTGVNPSDLFCIENSDGTMFGQISLQRKDSSTVYFAYTNEGGVTPLRNNTIEIQKWVHITLQLDFDKSLISVYADEKKMIENIPFVGLNGDVSVSRMTFGVDIDNIEFYSGTKCKEVEVNLNIPNEIVAGGSIRNAIKCDTKIKLNEVWHDIDSKYLNITPSSSKVNIDKEGYMVVNSEELGEDENIDIDAGIVISEQIYSARSTVTVRQNGEMSGEEYNKFMVDKATIIQNEDNTIVKLSSYNPENEDKSCYVLVGTYDENQLRDISFLLWEIPKLSYNQVKEFLLENSYDGDLRVYILNTDSLEDMQ